MLNVLAATVGRWAVITPDLVLLSNILWGSCISCFSDLNPLGVHSAPDSSGSSSASVGVVLGSCVATFFVAVIIMIVLCYLYIRHRRPRIPGSPHYMSSKQNPYVTVPLKETGSHHTKRALSSSSASSSNGSTPGSHKASNGGTGLSLGTPKLFSKPLVEYETATIKRNSHSLNGHIRADLDEDRFFWTWSSQGQDGQKTWFQKCSHDACIFKTVMIMSGRLQILTSVILTDILWWW